LTGPAYLNVTSIPLPAGDWDVSGSIGFIPGATTNTTQFIGTVSTTTNTRDTTPGRATSLSLPAHVPGAAQQNFAIPVSRFSLPSTTTVYLVAQSAFMVSTNGAATSGLDGICERPAIRSGAFALGFTSWPKACSTVSRD
jgi:hypothetical protein